ncbi:hypothetical protein C8R46DRAFT_1036741 [Mycena filopes]|nr:hypothetical protein C8R46DRAFT_1036741 [Mycena filopes]
MPDPLYDAHYDIDGATSAESLRVRGDHSIQHLSVLDLDVVRVIESDTKTKTWILVVDDQANGDAMELVVRVQGIVTKLDLTHSKATQIKAIKLSQYVQLAGPGLADFATAVQGVESVKALFSRYAGTSNTAPPEKNAATATIGASCRYFTASVDNPGAEIIPFAPSTDPLGLLAELQTDELFHTADNRVSYFKMSKDPLTSKPIYDESYAGMFRLGDIVEMQMVFVAFWAGDKIQAYSHLQSLTLLDNTFTKRAETARAAAVKVVSKPTIVRRKLDYSFEDEQVEDARKRLKGLRVGEDVVMTEKNQ